MSSRKPLRDIIQKLMCNPSPNPSDLARLKKHVAAEYRLPNVPSNTEILSLLKADEKQKLLILLRRKATRSISGVTVIATMTKPYPCPQAKPCAYCPGGPRLGVPQSYTGHEPAAMRGLQNKFNPFLQVKSRIRQLRATGHDIDKVELIIMGGTFPATPVEYQNWFVQRCLDAITEKQSSNLNEAKNNAEKSRIHNVGITVETRPDWAKETHVDQMLKMGVTRVEVGVQNPSNSIYRKIQRKHTVEDVVESTRIMKDAGLKIVYHMMPGLPNSNPEKDLEAFNEIFGNPNFRPDMLKIYPCLVIKNTRVHRWYKQKRFTPYTTEEAAGLIAKIKENVPRWMRIMRVQRDIPAPFIEAGVSNSNLRQIVKEKMMAEGITCKCIRCREVGHQVGSDRQLNSGNIELLTTKYNASEGEEVFISTENVKSDILIGYLRLRIPSEKSHRQEVRNYPCSIVRELHVYGSLVPVGKHVANAWQHKGFGSLLLSEAEKISAKGYDLRKILIMSALGTKQYYRKLGYKKDGAYMSKTLSLRA
jgi:elongator complex protein 3